MTITSFLVNLTSSAEAWSAFVGAIIGGVFTLIGVRQTDKYDRRRAKDDQQELVRRFLIALLDELQIIYRSYEEDIGTAVEALADGRGLEFHYPIYTDLLPFYHGNMGLIPHIADSQLRHRVVSTCTSFVTLMDCFRFNNTLLEDCEKQEQIARANKGDPGTDPEVQRCQARLNSYGATIRAAHFDVKKGIEGLAWGLSRLERGTDSAKGAAMRGLLKREWFLGGLAGVVATLIGFVFAVLWDIHKMEGERQHRRQAILSAISEEVRANDAAMKRNAEFLEREIALLGDMRLIVTPLSPLETSAWELAKASNPQELFAPDALVKLREVIVLAEQINELVDSREFYRINNSSMDNYGERLSQYDRLLLEATARLKEASDAYNLVAASEVD